VEAVGVVRTALLARMFGGPDATIENQIQFATLLESIRAMTPAKRNKALASADLSDVPPELLPVVERVIDEIKQHDLPMLQNKATPLAQLVFALKERYYLGDHEIEDTSEYDALVSKEWTRLTKGKTDVDSLMTLFLCISAGVPPKTTLTEKAAKTIIKQFRNEGFNHALATAWIKESAPHEKQEGLLEDWDNFIEEANQYLLDDWDTYLTGAIRFLTMHCHIQKAGNKFVALKKTAHFAYPFFI
jgi:hypothetical protein